MRIFPARPAIVVDALPEQALAARICKAKKIDTAVADLGAAPLDARPFHHRKAGARLASRCRRGCKSNPARSCGSDPIGI